MRILILLIFLSGCSSLDQTGAVKIKWHRGEDAFKQAKKLGLNVTVDQIKMLGFKYFDGEVCHVFAPDPPMKTINGKLDYENGQWGTLGHEVKHCFDGSFH